MNTGVEKAPNQAAQSLRIVRLASFGAAAVIAALVLLAIASLRYAPFWDAADAPSVAVLGEIAPPPPPPQRPHQAPRAPEVESAMQAPLAPAPEQQGPSEPVVITDPVWIERPRNLARFYPREAFLRGLSGQVVLDCIVETDGRLNCTVAAETPEALGFGDAALAIAARHVMRPATSNGTPVRGRYQMIVPFTAG